MKILVINTGSSSIKYQLFEMEDESVISSGMAEKIGEEEGSLTHRRYDKEIKLKRRFAEHKDAFQLIKELLVDKGIFAVGHRVVHGGERFSGSVLINDDVIDAIRQNIPIAPLHNPSNLEGIYILKELFPQIPHVAVFDTAFHQSMIEEAFLYAIPYSLYEEHRIRRYGFHGTSHAYVSEMAAAYMKRPLDQLNLVTIHLGNGASITAVRGGRSVDTSMGMTPLEGLIMGTRSGDMDPAIPFFLMDHLRMPPDEIYKMLNNESGLKGICGRNDMREILDRRENGDPLADLAVRMYCYRIKKYIGAYLAVLGRTDAIVFTAGIGENSSLIRELCLNGLEGLGIRIDKEKNRKNEAEISAEGSLIKVLVIPTDEELRIARETKEIVSRLS